MRLTDGRWSLGKDVKYFRIEDRLSFLFARFGSVDARTRSWWSTLREAIAQRNALVHPREVVDLKQEDTNRFVISIIEALDDLYQSIFGRGHPARRRGSQSTLDF